MNVKTFISVLAALMLTFSAQARRPKRSVLSFERDTVELGIIYMDEISRNFSIEVNNTGKAPLLLTSVEADCHCTDIQEYPDTILPKKTGSIRGTLFVDKMFPAELERQVMVYSNSVDTLKVCTLKASVRRR